MLVITSKWEQSGNDSGQKRNEGDEDFGRVSPNQLWLGNGMDEEFVDSDNRKIFLKEEKSHLLHLWQLADENDVLAHSLAKLSDSGKVDSDNIPSTAEHISNEKSNKIEENFKMDVSAAFKQLSRSVTLKEYREVTKNIRSLKADLRKSNDEEEKSDLRTDIFENEQIAKDLKNDLGL